MGWWLGKINSRPGWCLFVSVQKTWTKRAQTLEGRMGNWEKWTSWLQPRLLGWPVRGIEGIACAKKLPHPWLCRPRTLLVWPQARLFLFPATTATALPVHKGFCFFPNPEPGPTQTSSVDTHGEQEFVTSESCCSKGIKRSPCKRICLDLEQRIMKVSGWRSWLLSLKLHPGVELFISVLGSSK